MEDQKRSYVRTDLDQKLTLTIINDGTQRDLPPFDVEIKDVSLGGIGFYSENQLMVGEIFEGVLTIWTKQKINMVLKIVRIALEEEGYSYGSIYVGMGANDAEAIEIYQMLAKK